MPKHRDQETSVFGMTAGCPVHGDDAMRECTMCGGEFCRVCFPRSMVCPDCAEEDEADDESADPDFEDVAKVDDVIEDEPPDEADDQEEDAP